MHCNAGIIQGGPPTRLANTWLAHWMSHSNFELWFWLSVITKDTKVNSTHKGSTPMGPHSWAHISEQPLPSFAKASVVVSTFMCGDCRLGQPTYDLNLSRSTCRSTCLNVPALHTKPYRAPHCSLVHHCASSTTSSFVWPCST